MKMIIRSVKVILMAATIIADCILIWAVVFESGNFSAQNMTFLLVAVIIAIAFSLTMLYRWFRYERFFIASPIVTTILFIGFIYWQKRL